MTTYDHSQAPEADISSGQRPTPGPRKSPREYWNGIRVIGHTEARLNDSRRLTGIDAARGFALLGMIIVHTMPPANPSTGDPALVYELFAGHSAQLFGLLAGVSLALITGAATPHTGLRLRRDRVTIATRALLLLVFGMALNFTPLQVFNILPYYAVFFLFGLFFLGMSVRKLLVWAAAFAVAGPFLIYAINWADVVEVVESPTLVNLIAQPIDVMATLLAQGAYPALAWMAFIILGLALGRLDLRNLAVQVQMCIWGALAAGTAMISSEILMQWFGVFTRLVNTAPLSAGEVAETLEFGGTVPAYSWWWLVSNGPHSNTPFDVVSSAGLALLALGAFLIAAHVAKRWLGFLSSAGAMTFSLYTAHLLLLAYVGTLEMPLTWTFLQIIGAIAIGVAWQSAFGQGPLERIISTVSKATGRQLVPETTETKLPRRHRHRRGPNPTSASHRHH